ncbi:MAG: cupin domain-containing protein [Ilumatobacteraceae bacterium]
MLIRVAPDEPSDGSDAESSRDAHGTDVVMGEWSLTHASWTDLHFHEELNYVVEGELHVTYDDQTFVARPGDVVITPAGVCGRYVAPVYARMVFAYGPSTDGHATIAGVYEALD